MLAGQAVEVIDSEECYIELAHAIKELEQRHIERACVECYPLYAFTGKEATEQKVLEQCRPKIAGHARIEYKKIPFALETEIILI